jgi:hypothetical protein
MELKDREYDVVVKTWRLEDGLGTTQIYRCPSLDAARRLRATERQKDPYAYIFIRDAETLRLRG